MTTHLALLTLADIESLLEERAAIRGTPVLDGALPPDFIVDAALTHLRRGEDPRWWSFFVFVDPADGVVAGSGGFKGAPRDGAVEIGYGVAPARRRRGIATSAVRQLIRLARTAPEVTEVVAETAVHNVASRRVVEKAGFAHAGRRDSEEDGVVDVWRCRLDGRSQVATDGT